MTTKLGLSAAVATKPNNPVKLAAFGAATNVTLGLPLVRTSPDHGTAYDIAGEGIAEADSMAAALAAARAFTA